MRFANLRRFALPFVLALVLGGGLAGCGGSTGLEVTVATPPAWVVGTDFNKIHVEVTAEEGGGAGETYDVSPLTPKPYRVYVFADKTTHYRVTVRAELWQDGAIKMTRTYANVILKQGSVEPLLADLSVTP
jgi:hypothetical protein